MNHPLEEIHIIIPPNNLIVNNLISEAQETILISRQAVPNANFCNVLIAAKNRGVKINMLLSSPFYFRRLSINEIRQTFNNIAEEIISYTQVTVPEKEKWISILAEKGIEIRYIDHKKYLLNHSKYMIIDSNLAYIGSAPNEITTRLDVGLVTSCPKQISILQQLFNADFFNKKFNLPKDFYNLLIAPETMRDKIEQLMNEAEHSISMMFPLITDDDRIFQILKNKAKSGVVIRAICTPNMFSLDANIILDHKFLLKLIEIGVELKFSYDTPIHCRVISVDAECLNKKKLYIGSGHLKAHCFNFNREVGVITSLPKAVSEITNLFKNLWDKLPEPMLDNLL